MIFLKLAIITLTSLLYLACTESSVDVEDEVKETIPTIEGNFSLTPNVGGLRESVDVHINTGIWAKLSPGGRYSLYAKTDSLEVESFLFVDGVKCCEGGCRGVRDGDSLRYDFSCKVDEPTRVVLSLKNKNGKVLSNSFHHVRLDGEGIYSDHLSLNLIVAGAFDSTADGVIIDILSGKIGLSVQKIFDAWVDTVYVSYAKDHPIVGSLYLNNSVLYDAVIDDFNDLRDSWYESGRNTAFNIVLVDGVRGDLGGIGRFYFDTDLAKKDVLLVSFRNSDRMLVDSKIIQMVVAHELGHVLGVVHTTLTKDDLLMEGDYSLYEDGLVDTPYCQDIVDENKEILKFQALKKQQYRDVLALYQVKQNKPEVVDSVYERICPDVLNIMYPYYECSFQNDRVASPMQRAIVKKNLTLIPH